MKNHESEVLIPAIERATHAVALWIEREFHDLRLTQAEAHVLGYLARRPDSSINDLHRSFGHKRSTLTSLLDRLEDRGWLRRAAHPASRRLVRVELTDAGRLVGERVSAALRALEERVSARSGSGDVAAALRLLHALEVQLSEEEPTDE
ncbi:MAG TPA: MarR family transcriptional regulator [Ktedonobacterales bacterium]|nr:MarR family transcriptional regulator [Ktedonobacterales bacterium]